MLITDKVEYFVADNDSPNDTAMVAICRELNLANPARRRPRCLGHIINLSAKDLLFGKEEGSFDFEISGMAGLKLEVRQALELLVFRAGARRVPLDSKDAATHSEIQGPHYRQT